MRSLQDLKRAISDSSEIELISILQVTRKWNYSRIIWFKYAKLSCKGLYSLQSILKYSNHIFWGSKGQINRIAHWNFQHLWLLPVWLQLICWDPHLGFSCSSGRPIQICDRCEIHHCLKKLNGMLKCVNKISTYGWVGYNTRVHNVSLIVMYLNSHDLRIKKFSTNR